MKPEAEQDRGDGPAGETAPGSATWPGTAASTPSSVPAPSRNEKRRPAGVGDDAGRDLEDDLAEGEEGVGREGLRVVEAGVEQEERVDAPDERRRERREQGQEQIVALDRAGRVGHRRRMLGGLARHRVRAGSPSRWPDAACAERFELLRHHQDAPRAAPLTCRISASGAPRRLFASVRSRPCRHPPTGANSAG